MCGSGHKYKYRYRIFLCHWQAFRLRVLEFGAIGKSLGYGYGYDGESLCKGDGFMSHWQGMGYRYETVMP